MVYIMLLRSLECIWHLKGSYRMARGNEVTRCYKEPTTFNKDMEGGHPCRNAFHALSLLDWLSTASMFQAMYRAHGISLLRIWVCFFRDLLPGAKPSIRTYFFRTKILATVVKPFDNYQDPLRGAQWKPIGRVG